MTGIAIIVKMMNNTFLMVKPVLELKCERCGYVWYKRMTALPKCCPKCKSYAWEYPKETK